MAIPLGRYASEGLDHAKLRFEKGRKTALGVAEGVVGAGLGNATAGVDDVSRGLRMAQTQQGREEQEGQIRQKRIQTATTYNNRLKVIQRYIDTPFDQRGTFKTIRQNLLASDPELATALDLVDQREQERMQTAPRTTSGVLQEAPVNAQLVPPVPITKEETVGVRGPAFDPSTAVPRTLGEAEQLTPIESGGYTLPKSIEGRLGFDIPGTGLNYDLGRAARNITYVDPTTAFLSPLVGPSTFGTRGAATRVGKAIAGRPAVIRNTPTLPQILGTGLAVGSADVAPAVAFSLKPVAKVVGTKLATAASRQAKTILDNQQIITVYHGTNADAANSIKSSGLDPKSGLTTNRQIAELFAKNNYGPDAEVLEFRVPRTQLRNPNPRETWFVVSDQPQRPVTGVRRIATEVGGTKYTPQEPGGPTPDELAFGSQQGESRLTQAARAYREAVGAGVIGRELQRLADEVNLASRPSPLRAGPPVGETGPQRSTGDLSQLGEDELEELYARTNNRVVRAEGKLERLLGEGLAAGDEEYDDAKRALDFIEGEYNRIGDEVNIRRGPPPNLKPTRNYNIVKRPEGLGPGTPQGPYRGIEETGIPGEVPPIEQAVPDISDLRRDLASVLRGETKPPSLPRRKRGQYVGPALRRTLLAAGYTKEEIAELGKLPTVGGGAEAADIVPRYNRGQFRPGYERLIEETTPKPPTPPEKVIEDAVAAGTMTREAADQILARLNPPVDLGIPPSRGATQLPLVRPTEPTEPVPAPTETAEQFRLRMAQSGPGSPGGVPPTGYGPPEQPPLMPDLPAPNKPPIKFNLFNELAGLIGTTLASKASLDIGALFRQAQVLGWQNPKRWLGLVGPTVRSTFSEKAAQAIMKDLRRDRWYNKIESGERAGLGFLDNMEGRVAGHEYEWGPGVAQTERAGGYVGLNDSYISRAAQRLPWIRGSERNYAIALNKQGGETYADVAEHMWQSGVRDPKMYQHLREVLNHGRGYGAFNPGVIGKSVSTFFSGRNLVSRFQVILDPFMQPGNLFKPSPRQLAAKSLVSMVMGDLALLGFLSGVGALTGVGKVEWNPTKPGADWLKYRVGNTRLDPWGGFNPLGRLIVRMSMAALTDAGVAKTSWDLKDARDALVTFFANKEAPVVRLFTDAAGLTQPFEEHKFLSPKTLADLWAPFITDDVWSAVKEHGVKGIAVAPISEIGIGAPTYTAYQDTAAGQLQQIPRYTGLDESDRREIFGSGLRGTDERVPGFLDRVDEIRDLAVQEGRATQQQVANTPMEHTIKQLGLKEGRSKEFIEWAIRLNKNPDDPALLNRDWLRFVVENEDELREQAPYLFDRWLDEFINLNRRKAAGQ